MSLLESNLLTIIILLPVIGALAVVGHSMFATRRNDVHYKWIALLFTLVTFAASLLLLAGAGGESGAFRFEQNVPWINAIVARYHLGVDGISLWLVLLTTFIMPIAILSSWTDVSERQASYYMFLLLLEAAMIGVFVALDLLVFYLFFEASLVPMFFLIGIWGGKKRIYAAVKFFIFTALGSLLMLAGILALYFIYGSFDYTVILAAMRRGNDLNAPTEALIFAAFALAFLIKVPIFPLHTWLPDAHTEAPTAGSVILAAVLLKMGTYGLMRFNLSLFPAASNRYAWIIIVLAIIGIIYGALVAMVQPDVKRLVAYSSVSHMGFVVLGIFSFTDYGMQGALYQMLNHGVSTGALFLLVGMIYERRHTREIKEYGGLVKSMPLFSTFMVFAALSSVGLPILNGFVGEFLIMLGMWNSSYPNAWIATMLAATGVIWAAVYMLWMLQRVLFGRITNDANRSLKDLNRREIGLLAPLLVLMIVMGVYPAPFLNRARASIELVRARVVAPNAGGTIRLAENIENSPATISVHRENEH